MKLPEPKPAALLSSAALADRADSAGAISSAVAARGPIEFRFVLKFAPQMSTPCSRGLAVNPRGDQRLIRHAPRLFQTHLERHSVLQ